MTTRLQSSEVAQAIDQAVPGSVAEVAESAVVVVGDRLLEIARFLKESPELAFDFLSSISAVDYLDYLEVIYHLTSISHNHALVLKTRCYTRDDPAVPSVISLWQGADFQEREVYDLMGVAFPGHPDLKRIMLWEGFEGHPLRKNFIKETPS